MDKKASKNLDKPITESFFIEYMDDFARSVARGFSGMQEYIDKRFNKIDNTISSHGDRLDRIELTLSDHGSKLDRIEHTLSDHSAKLDQIENEIAEVKFQLNTLDKRTDQDDSALFSDIDKLRSKVAKLEKEVKFLKLKQQAK